jgi:hypothetical protein
MTASALNPLKAICLSQAIKGVEMSEIKRGRGLLVLVSMLGLMSLLFSASASATGGPLSVTGTMSNPFGVNYLDFTASANPNGYATTLRIEYRESPSESFKIAASKEIGSGSSPVSWKYSFNGLKPVTEYTLRTTAVNSHGTVSSTGELFWSRWGVGKSWATKVSSFASTGKLRLEYTAAGYPVKLECNESGYGTLNHPGGATDTYHVSATGCVAYYKGVETCKAPSLSFTLDGTYTSLNPSFEYPMCGESEGGATPLLVFSEPVRAKQTSGAWVQEVIEKLTLTGNVVYGGSNATLSIETNWQLTGENKGEKFVWWYEE